MANRVKIVAVDIGDKRIGVAVGDSRTGVAVPRATFDVNGNVVASVIDLVANEGAEFLVIGLPVSLNGSLGSQGRRIAEMAREIANEVSVPVKTWDERLTSVEASRRLRCATRASSRRRRSSRQRPDRGLGVDALAATIILQSYLDGQPGVVIEEGETDQKRNVSRGEH